MLIAGTIIKPSEGFTLLETLIAMAILAAISSALFSFAPAMTQRSDVLNASTKLDTLLSEANARAAASGRPTVLVAAPAGLRLAGSHKKTVFIPRKVQVTIVAARELSRGNDSRIIFYPDGTSTGGKIILSEGPQRVERLVNWLGGGDVSKK